MSNQKKSSLKIGINGLGRIGRLIFRQGFDSLDIRVINGTRPADQLAHFLQYDSVQGPWAKHISVKVQSWWWRSRLSPAFRKKNPVKIHWDKYNVDVVIECTGRF